MWIRTQDKSTLIDCSVFTIEKHKIHSKDDCEEVIAKKYNLNKQGDWSCRYYNLTKEQSSEVNALYNATDNNCYWIVNDIHADGDMLASYNTEAEALTVMTLLEESVSSNQVFHFPCDIKEGK